MRPKKISVLLIDDDEIDCRLVKELLQRVKTVDYRVDMVHNLELARTHLLADKHDVVLIDYFLSHSNALALLKESKEKECQAPAIVITGCDHEEIDAQVMHAGAADYLPKEELGSALLDRSIRHALERNRYLQQLEFLANRDPLTNLVNRAKFDLELERAVALAQRRSYKFAVLLLDLDRFKDINDTLGHDVGDILLTLVANRLRKILRKEDVVARLGGDEFTVLLSHIDSPTEVEKVCRKILQTMSKPTPLNESSLVISCSVGVSIFPENGKSPIGLMKSADLALYKAKDMGRNTFCFFNQELQNKLQKDAALESGIREGLEQQQFSLYYQPQIDLTNGQLTGFEALVRWQHPEKGFISPVSFIPVAEKTGLINNLGAWILETAVKQLAQWHQQGFDFIKLAVNISPKQLLHKTFIPNLAALISDNHIIARKLTLEVTEALLLDADDSNHQLFRRIKDTGVELSIDDFGTGYSSLAYLKNFPVDQLKIDRSFISESHYGQKEQNITNTIIALGHALNLTVIAEGVETDEQAAKLVAQGCDIGQGYLFGKPVDAAQTLELLTTLKTNGFMMS